MNPDNYTLHNIYYGANASLLKKANYLRLNMTLAEKTLWEYLNNKQLLGFVFRRQHPIDIFIVDFYCHAIKLVIEVDGLYHGMKDQQVDDFSRTQELSKFGITIIRFTNDQIVNSIDKVVQSIKKTVFELSEK